MNFFQLSETARYGHRAGQAIRAGLNAGPDFWDQFQTVCNHAEGLAELLDVPAHKVTSWGSRLRQAIEQVRREDDHSPKAKKKMLLTGR